MRYYLAPHQAPPSWHEFKLQCKSRWLMPLLCTHWAGQWVAYVLGSWSFVEVLEYMSAFSVLVAVIVYFTEAPERTKTRHYQAWQVINTAQGKGGNGGRVDALSELNADGVALVGVDLTDAFLQDVQLQHADLRRSVFRGTDLKDAVLSDANLEEATLHFANLRNVNLHGANLTDANLADTDLANVTLTNANLTNAQFDRADLRGADLGDAQNCKQIKSMHLANIHGVRNAPADFIVRAMELGAVDMDSDAAWSAAVEKDEAAKK